MKIIILDEIDLDQISRKKLESLASIKIFDDINNDPRVILSRIADSEIVTANYVDLTADIIDKAENLKYIIVPAVGYDWIDVEAANRRNIKVLNCPTYNSQAVAEHAIAMMFAINRRIVEAHNDILQGKFNPKVYVGREISGKKMLCVGNGNIGSKILFLAKGLGMKTDFIDSKTSAVEIDRKITEADYLVIAVPLTAATNNLIDKRRISLLKSSATIINVARGLVVDQLALYQSLSNNLIAGAALDVFPNDQTLTEASKQIIQFAKLPNVVATPHIAFNTEEARNRLGEQLLANIHSCLEQKPLNTVN